MKKRYLTILYILLVLLFFGGTIWTLQFSHRIHAQRVCENVRISIDNSNADVFVTEDEIVEHLLASQLHPKGLPISLNTYAVESFLAQNSAIQDVDVFVQLSGEVDIDIVQRQPIVRIENAQRQQFYIGSDGCLMATNPKHTSRLIVANGYIAEPFIPNQNVQEPTADDVLPAPILNRIYQLATHIRNSEFLNTWIEQIYINAKHEFELVPKIGRHIILMGDAENYQDQFKRLEQFYTYGIQKAGWDAYRIINLKYNNQVVCTKTQSI
ncbi:MAG: hypothetical protein LBU91_06630 [Bacteroidales bacterium]|jgi:cell division protein FtsQ|nr:hypothetical protein [Bacteroidales bacterium]